MQQIFLGKQLPLLYQRSLERDGLKSRDHIERAGTAFVHEFVRHYQRGVRVVHTFAGAGRCGAYALRAARLLADEGYRVAVYLIYHKGHISAEVEELLPLMEDCEGLNFTPIYQELHRIDLRAEDVIIDGIFGAELSVPLSGGYEQLIQYLNRSKARRISIELPSGLFAEDNSGNHLDKVFRAERTIAFDSPKLAFFFRENKPYVGLWRHIPLGISQDAKADIPVSYHLIEDSSIASELASRHSDLEGGGKQVFIPILQEGHAGAALLIARAAQRSGLSAIELTVPTAEQGYLQLSLPELRISSASLESYQQQLHSYAALAITRGFGTDEAAFQRLRTLLGVASTRPFLLAQDALQLLTRHRELLRLIPAGSILLADETDFDSLTTRHTLDAERLIEAREFAQRYQLCLILRGEATAICLPTGSVLFDVTGNSSLRRPGCNEVLYGLLIGLLGQYRSGMTAAMLGVHLQGLAAELYAGKQSERSLIASDLLAQISRAYHQLES